jgi:hypothetical protein
MNLPSIENTSTPASLGQTPRMLNEYSLSYGQKALYFIQMLTPHSAAHNIVYGVHLDGDFDFGAFVNAYYQMAARHPALRTRFALREGLPVQQVFDSLPAEIDLRDAQTCTREQLDELIKAETYRPFDLMNGPLVRLKLFKLSATRHLLLTVLHHIITDMWSMAIFIDEITRLYKAEVTHIPAELKPAMGDYAEYAQWQTEFLQSAEGQSLSYYWHEKLSGVHPVLSLATDYPRPPVQTDHGASVSQHIDAQHTLLLKEAARSLGVSLQTLALSIFQILLHRYSGQDDILTGYPKFGRRRADARLMGYFINPVVLK